MEVGGIRFYKERWKAVDEIEQWGIRYRRYGFVERILIVLKFKSDKEVDKMQIRLRWARLKELFEQGNCKTR